MATRSKHRRTRHKNSAPALPGTVNTHYVNGRDGVKRGPYYVRRWREGTKQRKAYVRPRDVERVRAACAAWKAERHEDRLVMREALGYSRMSAQQLIAELRRLEAEWS